MRGYRWGVLALAALQPVSSALFQRYSPTPLDSGPTNDAALTPAGWAFSIWGLITLLCVAVALRIVVRGTGVARERWALAHLAVIFTGFTAWLGFAAFELYWGTVAVFAVMAVALLRLVAFLGREPVEGPRWWAVLLRFTVGLYAGWATVASFVNVAAALIGSGADLDTTWGTLVQLALLVGAATVAVLALRASRGNVGYAAALLWALVAAAIGAAAASTLLAVTAAVAALVILTAEVVVRSRTSPAA